jgi:hypothetical protein
VLCLLTFLLNILPTSSWYSRKPSMKVAKRILLGLSSSLNTKSGEQGSLSRYSDKLDGLGSIHSKINRISLFHRVQTESETHPGYYPMDTGDKAAGS